MSTTHITTIVILWVMSLDLGSYGTGKTRLFQEFMAKDPSHIPEHLRKTVEDVMILGITFSGRAPFQDFEKADAWSAAHSVWGRMLFLNLFYTTTWEAFAEVFQHVSVFTAKSIAMELLEKHRQLFMPVAGKKAILLVDDIANVSPLDKLDEVRSSICGFDETGS